MYTALVATKKADPIRPLPRLVLEQRHADACLKAGLGAGPGAGGSAFTAGSTPSLLFTGPEGTGKEYTAIDFARRLCCERAEPCELDGELCESCRMASRLEHPGIHLIYPTPTQGSNEGEEGDVDDLSRVLEEKRRDIFARYRFTKKPSIRIARARAVIQRANTRPFDSPLHVFIFADAHAMREEAQNALLKLVEEPPAHSVLILITTNPDSILYTIRSRCQRIRFSPLKTQVVEAVLRDYYGIDEKTAQRAAALSQGSITRAAALSESFDDSERRQAAALVAGLTVEPESWAIAQALQVGKGSNREGVARFLDQVALVFRDLMAGDPALFVNRDIAGELEKIAAGWRRGNLPGVIDRIGRARAEVLLGNMHIDSTLTRLLLDIHRAR
jgi:DNA polymerase-3 subunit delta'